MTEPVSTAIKELGSSQQKGKKKGITCLRVDRVVDGCAFIRCYES